ncbi:MAG: cytochrome C, partial [Mariprofundaceae bacterium]|nr:cytochrome C [Mariprofundaceae bacterium]
MKKAILYIHISLVITCFSAFIAPTIYELHAKENTAEKTAHPMSSTADHSQFKALQKHFKNGPEVTKACLSCHNKAGSQIQKNIHWTWTYHNKKTGQLLG